MPHKVVNIGSLNIDDVFNVPHFVLEGETLGSFRHRVDIGGKGLNQSVALCKAGVSVSHVGCIGKDGTFLVDFLSDSGVDVRDISIIDTLTGHAVIQVNQEGKNAIIILPGSNHCLSKAMIENALSRFTPGGILVMQNETNCLREAIEAGNQLGLRVAFNPAPCDPEIANLPLHLLDYLILNESEAQLLCDTRDPEIALQKLQKISPKAVIVITLGAEGSIMLDANGRKTIQPAFKVPIVNSTAAGDTFIGYLLAGESEGRPLTDSLREASLASALCVSRDGAAVSIPLREEVMLLALERQWEALSKTF